MKPKSPPAPLILGETQETLPGTPAAPGPGPSTKAAERLPAPARHAYLAAGILSVSWAATATTFAALYRSDAWHLEFAPMQIALLAAVVILPVLLIGLGAWSVRQGGELILEARRARARTDAMIAPALAAAGETGDVVKAVRTEIERAAELAATTTARLAALHSALADDSARMQAITEAADAAATRLTQTMTREREAMAALSAELDMRATTISENITRQTEMVTQASDLAQAQLREAETVLATRAAELAAAAGDAAELSSLAGQQLSLNADHLREVGGSLEQGLGTLNAGLSNEGTRLEALEATLREQQAAVVERLSHERSMIIEAVAQGRIGSEDISAAAAEVTETLRRLIAEAAGQIGTVSQTARSEQAAIEAQSRAALEELGRLADDTRDAARKAIDETSSTALSRVQTARETLEQLGEMAFTSGQRADEIFESRFAAARRLIEESARLVGEAGRQSAEQVESGLVSARSAVAELTGLLDSLEARARSLPVAVEAAIRAQRPDTRLETQVSQTVATLSERARQLSHSARTEPDGAISGTDSIIPPITAAQALASAQAPPASDDEDEDDEGPPLSFETRQPPSQDSGTSGQRPRLRLTMTDQDRDLKTVFEPVRPDRARRESSIVRSWRDILRKMEDTPDNAADNSADGFADDTSGPGDAALPARLRREIEALGVDPAALLPNGRIEEISRSLGDGDLDAGRDAVRRLAPAAVRRLTRRIDGDPEMKAEARQFVGSFGGLVLEALAQDHAAASGLLGSDQGRIFLLLDASVGPPA
jgi:hypothetical protein